MKRSIAGCALFLATAAAEASEVPFFSTHDVPDYSASMIVRSTNAKPESYKRSIVHHDGWTRVEEVRDDETVIYYGNFFDNVLLITNADFTGVRVTKAVPSRDYLSVKGSRQTEDADSQAGEACRWWEVFRKPAHEVKPGPFWFSCLSDDGIEIGTKVLYSDKSPMTEMKLVRLTRTPVAESEVSPPARLFDPGFWLKPLRDYPDKPADAADFEVRMIGRASERRLLRHYPWRFEEFHGNDGSVRFNVWNELENQRIGVYSSKDGHSLSASRSPLDQNQSRSSFDRSTGQVDLKKQDRYLGESCSWFDMMPGVMDAGHSQCLTADGIPLRDVYSSGWGRGEDYTAASVERRAVDLKEMILPPELLDPSRWGFSVVD